MAQITGIFIDPENNIFERRTIESSLESYYKELRCDLIDITRRTINGHNVAIICDDEGLFKEDNLPSAIYFNFERGLAITPGLVGPIFIISENTDEEGGDLSLEEEYFEPILSSRFDYHEELDDGSIKQHTAVVLEL